MKISKKILETHCGNIYMTNTQKYVNIGQCRENPEKLDVREPYLAVAHRLKLGVN